MNTGQGIRSVSGPGDSGSQLTSSVEGQKLEFEIITNTALMPMVWAFKPFVSSLKIQTIRFKKKFKKTKHAIQIYIHTRKQTFKAHTLYIVKKCCHSIQPTFIKSCFRPEIILIINSDDLQTACPTVNKVFRWLLIEFLQFLCNENYYDPLLQTQKDQSWWP